MRVLALDLGSKRIGIAVSDRSGTLASPLTVLQRSGRMQLDHERMRARGVEEEVERRVVGLPLSMDGSVGTAARAAIKEVEALSTVVGVPVETLDERLTTVTADRMLFESGMRGQDRRKIIDKVAAAVILQTWLDAHGPSAMGGARCPAAPIRSSTRATLTRHGSMTSGTTPTRR